MKKNLTLKLAGIALSMLFIGCNNSDKKPDPAANDTTASTPAKDTTMQSPVGDATTVAPQFYKLLKDSLGIRILQITYKPGDSSVMHSHPDVALYVIDGGKMEFINKDGSKMTADMKSGMATVQQSTVHSVKNVGTNTVKALLFEINRPNTAGTADESMSANKIDPAHYKTLIDSLNIKVMLATYKPGESSKMHMHPDNAIYVLQGGKSEFTQKDGTKQTRMMEAGMSSIAPGGTHSVKNTGNTTVKVVMVEVNRPSK